MTALLLHDIKTVRQLQTLIDLHADFAAQCFRWAELRKRDPRELFEEGDLSREEAERRQDEWMAALPTTQLGAQYPGRSTHLIDLAFADPTQSAERWDEWGYRLTAAHDELVQLLERALAVGSEAG